VELRPYAQKTTDVLRSVASRLGGDDAESTHPLLTERPIKKVLMVVLTSDRGLAGAFNSSMQRVVERAVKEKTEEGFEVSLAVIGRKGRDYFKRRNIPIAHDYVGAYEGGAARAAEIARELTADFVGGEFDQVLISFNEFRSAISQKPVTLQVLPIRTDAGDEASKASGGGGGGDVIYEPTREALLERLLPMYVEVMVFRAMLESQASEHGARMTAMDNATNNAKKMIGALTLQYNRARQAAITKELMEIIGGAEALKE